VTTRSTGFSRIRGFQLQYLPSDEQRSPVRGQGSSSRQSSRRATTGVNAGALGVFGGDPPAGPSAGFCLAGCRAIRRRHGNGILGASARREASAGASSYSTYWAGRDARPVGFSLPWRFFVRRSTGSERRRLRSRPLPGGLVHALLLVPCWPVLIPRSGLGLMLSTLPNTCCADAGRPFAAVCRKGAPPLAAAAAVTTWRGEPRLLTFLRSSTLQQGVGGSRPPCRCGWSASILCGMIVR